MKKYIPGAVWILAISAALYVVGNAIFGARTITATGVCANKVAKDKFSITLQFRAVEKTAGASLKAAQNAADDIARQIRAMGDKSIEVQTTNLYSYEKTEYVKEKSIPLGIETTLDLEIISSGKDSVAAAMNMIAGVKKVSVFPQQLKNFSSRELTDEATAKCLEAAVQDARAKAEAIAEADGERLGRLASAALGAARTDNVRPLMAFKEAAADYIQTADGEISVSVSATFYVK
ncbi:MAG: SIMPL domain-containing protein [Rickettsiales bacterium]|jgi:uncharacterized protein YggE|nr:SIMPL domain-containing protein [Rickettsiales bacterium]